VVLALEQRWVRAENGRVIFEPEAETLPREQLVVLQAERLRSLVAYVKERVPLYREARARFSSTRSDGTRTRDLRRDSSARRFSTRRRKALIPLA